MWKGCFFAVLLCALSMPVMAAGNYIPKQFSNVNTGEGMYPYSLNNRRNENLTIKKKNNVSGIGGATPMQSVGKRGVVKRPSPARAATTTTTSTRRVVPRSNTARSATNNSAMRNTYSNNNRGVVARSGTRNNSARAATNMRTTNLRRSTTINNTSSTNGTSQKCFANYKECMEMYCLREDTAYNRCYCSAKLAQIDSKYQKKIDNLIQQIIVLKNTTTKPSADYEELSSVEDYWDATVGQYTKTNPWVNIDNALNIDWASTESRVRGQNAFNTGHQYCVNYLRTCSYMASNLRDAYKSEIARDCATYESTLQKIQTAAESVIANYDNQ